MATFQPRLFDQILQNKIDFMRANSTVADFNIGGVVRTALEADSLEDDEQNFQMVLLKNSFALQSASGTDLDKRVADFGIIRLLPAVSTGYVQFKNGQAKTSNLIALTGGNTLLELENTDEFPVSGNITIGEGTANKEVIAYIANDTGTHILTLAVAAGTHSIGDIVTYTAGDPDKTIPAGAALLAPATSINSAVDIVTTSSGTIIDGYLYSELVPATSVRAGKQGNVGAGRIIQFSGSAPFPGAEVSNPTSFSSGRDLESDAALRDRARAAVQSLTKGTVLTLSSQVLGVEDTLTKQRVVSARLKEDFVNHEVVLYVDDGSGTAAIQNTHAVTSLSAGVGIGATILQVNDISDFPPSGYILLDPDTSDVELLAYESTSTGPNSIIIASGSSTTKTHLINADVFFVDVISESTESGERRFSTQLSPIVRGSQLIYVKTPTVNFDLKTENVDYEINIGTGDLTFVSPGFPTGLPATSVVVAHYSYYSGLIATVQKIVEGDPNDTINFPGLKAAGIKVIVESPTIKNILVHVSIVAAKGFKEEDLIDSVVDAIQTYINSLGVGEDVIVAELIQQIQSITTNGVEPVFDTVVIAPTSNVVVLEDELPHTDPSLITVT